MPEDGGQFSPRVQHRAVYLRVFYPREIARVKTCVSQRRKRDSVRLLRGLVTADERYLADLSALKGRAIPVRHSAPHVVPSVP